MQVHGVDLLEKHATISYVTSEDGLAWADIIVCAMNLTKENVGYFSYETLKRARKGVVFVNVARGEFTPTEDMVMLLDEGHLGGLALDVYENESTLAVACAREIGFPVVGTAQRDSHAAQRVQHRGGGRPQSQADGPANRVFPRAQMVSLAGAVKSQPVIRRISAAETRPLRQAILRPHQRVEELVYPGDDSPDAAHFGAFLDGELIGIVSVCHEPPPHGEANAGAWRIRGMAVVPQLHRRGIGSLLLRACIDHARQHGGTMMWFNARTPAVPFYQAHCFRVRGEEFVVPHAGPHYFMWSEIRVH